LTCSWQTARKQVLFTITSRTPERVIFFQSDTVCLKVKDETEAEHQQLKFIQWPMNGEVRVQLANPVLYLLRVGKS
jgi:hypothetical protein